MNGISYDQEELNGKEREAFVDDIAEAIRITINTVVNLADKHNVDRDNALQYFAELMGEMAGLCTVENWSKSDD